MDVEFKDLSYTIAASRWNSKSSSKVILDSVSGRFQPGQLSAIMGPSGAGKTSLLNALSGYSSTGVGGAMHTNGRPRDERMFRKCSCYITQDDLLQPWLTMRELMNFAGRLKLPSNVDTTQRNSTISEILSKLGLTQNENTFTSDLSGGQKKRLSVALELINNPPVLFLDEPTSGLDNVSTKHTLQMLRDLSRQGRTIVCTIHQPSASLFQLFDHVYVVAQGVCVYQGTTMGLLPFMASAGLACPLNYNPADYIIEMTDGEDNSIVRRLSKAIENGKIMWRENVDEIFHTDDQREGSAQIESTSVFKLNGAVGVKNGRGYAISTWSQFVILLERMLLQIKRNTTALWIQILHHLGCGILMSFIFFGLGNDGLQWFIHLKCIVAVVVFHSYTWVLAPVLSYPIEVKLLKREHFNRWYGLNSYYMALTLSTVPMKIMCSVIFLTILYPAWGMPYELSRFIVFCLIGIITSLVAEGLGFAIGSTFSITNGAAVGPAFIAPFLGLACYGFDFAKNIPFITHFFMKLSFMRIAVVSLVLALYGMDRPELNCSDQFGYCHFQDPKVLLRMLDIEHQSVWLEVLALFGLLVVFRLVFYILLKRRLST